MIAAAYIEDLEASTRLVLMAIADSSDEHTREAAPGLPKLRAWSGLSRSRTLAIVKKLEDAGYLERIAQGRRGRRAVYQVFPAGVPAIPHPDEVAARYPEDRAEDQVEPVDNSENKGPAGRTLEKLGSCEPPVRVLPARPLHFPTSVLKGATPTEPTPRPVDKPAPPASTAPPPGFPGARRGDLLPPNPLTARGARNMPCPRHPDFVVPCGRCAHAAANADQAAIQLAQEEARKAIHRARPATPDPAATEENTA